MRFNPRTDRAIDIDTLAAECMAAVLKRDEENRQQLEACFQLAAATDRY